MKVLTLTLECVVGGKTIVTSRESMDWMIIDSFSSPKARIEILDGTLKLMNRELEFKIRELEKALVKQ